ncbi:unnamed protein product [Camellia sinensis]
MLQNFGLTSPLPTVALANTVLVQTQTMHDGGAEKVVTKEVIDFVRLLEDEIDKFNAFFVNKEEEQIERKRERSQFDLRK